MKKEFVGYVESYADNRMIVQNLRSQAERWISNRKISSADLVKKVRVKIEIENIDG
jgi:hypothetical protein